ncbi:MAG: adenylyltransferase/cytidyltransferase family protein [Candidatus Micrarchaeia archaeon]|jgi:FAD synthetase
MRKVLVFGSFDFLHAGHIYFFESAKKYGDFLVACVARDGNVERAKGRKPFFSEKERLRMVAALRVVDKACLGSKSDFYAAARREKPNVIVLGYDQPADENAVHARLAELGLKTKVVRLKRGFFPGKYKSSKIREYLCT